MEIEAKRRLQRKARSCLEQMRLTGKNRGAPSFNKDGKSVDLVELYSVFDRLRREGIILYIYKLYEQKQNSHIQ